MANCKFRIDVTKFHDAKGTASTKVTNLETGDEWMCRVTAHHMNPDKKTPTEWYEQYVDVSQIPGIQSKGRLTIKRRIVPEFVDGRIKVKADTIPVTEYSDLGGRGSGGILALIDIID